MKPVFSKKYMYLAFLGMAAIILLTACGPSGLQVGDQAPDFSLPTASGSEVSLDDYSGEQPVLLYFHMALG